MNRVCVDAREFVPHGDYGDCIFSDMAKEDLDKLKKRDFSAINLKEALAKHLGNINPSDERILKVLPHS
jgi:hypothetical protein